MSADPTAPIALLEVIDRDGRVRRALPISAWPVRIGRAIDNDVVLDDPHVAPHHAVIDAGIDPGDAAGRPRLLALPSVNGIRVGRRRVAAGDSIALPLGDAGWTVGNVRLRARLAGEPLAPERALTADPNHPGTVLLALLLWAWVLAAHWVGLDPGSRPADWLQPLLFAPAALAGWCASWGLVSKLFQQRFEFWPHLAVAVRYLLAAQAAVFVLTWTGSVFSLELLSRIDGAVYAAVALAMLVAHARLVLPDRGRRLAAGAAGLYLAGCGILIALNLQRQDRVFDELYMTLLPPPGLRAAGGVTPQQFLRESESLRATLDANAQRANEDEREDDETE